MLVETTPTTEQKSHSTKNDASLDEYIFIPDNYEYRKIRFSDILYLEADGSYVCIKTTNNRYQLSINLKNLIDQLSSDEFIRISRKHIVNRTYIERINGSSLLVIDRLHNEIRLPFSKRKRNEILAQLPIIKIKH
jgi:DNA-binding LytR/AlgR family response regulator